MEDTKNEMRLAAVLFAIIGIGYLFPFSALTQPVDYWHKIFPDFNIEFPLTTLYLWANLIFLGIIVFFGGEPSYNFRIVGGFVGQLLVLIIVPSLYFLHLSEDYNYLFVMISVAIVAIVTAFIDSVAISFAAQYPSGAQESLQFGIGLSTFLGSIYRCLTKIAFPSNEVVESSLLYFYTGAITILLCIFAYYYLLSLPISKRCLQYGIHLDNEDESIGSDFPDLEQKRESFYKSSPKIGSFGLKEIPFEEIGKMTPNSYSNKEIKDYTRFVDIQSEIFEKKYGSLIETSQKSGNGTNENDKLLVKNDNKLNIQSNKESLGSSQRERINSKTQNFEYEEVKPRLPFKNIILPKIIFNEFLVFLVFFSTLLMWPPLVTEIKSFNFPILQETQWYSLLLLTLFSASDCLGRLMTGYRGFLTKNNIWIVIFLRLGLFPLLLMCVKGIFFRNDFFSIFFVFLLGHTNGYIGSLSIIMVSECVEDHEKGMAGSFTGFFLNLGLVLGATAALLVEKLCLSD